MKSEDKTIEQFNAILQALSNNDKMESEIEDKKLKLKLKLKQLKKRHKNGIRA